MFKEESENEVKWTRKADIGKAGFLTVGEV